jgi:hypothetical protein
MKIEKKTNGKVRTRSRAMNVQTVRPLLFGKKFHEWIFFLKLCTCTSERVFDKICKKRANWDELFFTRKVRTICFSHFDDRTMRTLPLLAYFPTQFVFHILMADDAYPTPLSLVPDTWRTKRAIFYFINVYYLEVHLSGRIFARHRTICPEQILLWKKFLPKKNYVGLYLFGLGSFYIVLMDEKKFGQ